MALVLNNSEDLSNKGLVADTCTEAYCYEHKTENRNFIGYTGVIAAHCSRNIFADIKTGRRIGRPDYTACKL